MRIEVNDNAFWLFVWAIVVVGVLSVLYISLDYSYRSSEQVKNAPTCEKAVLLQNSGTHAEVTMRLMACSRQLPTIEKAAQ